MARNSCNNKVKVRKDRQLPKKLRGLGKHALSHFGVLYPEKSGPAAPASMASGSSQNGNIPIDELPEYSTTPSPTQTGSSNGETPRGNTDTAQIHQLDFPSPMPSYQLAVPNQHQHHHELPVQAMQYQQPGPQPPVDTPSWDDLGDDNIPPIFLHYDTFPAGPAAQEYIGAHMNYVAHPTQPGPEGPWANPPFR